MATSHGSFDNRLILFALIFKHTGQNAAQSVCVWGSVSVFEWFFSANKSFELSATCECWNWRWQTFSNCMYGPMYVLVCVSMWICKTCSRKIVDNFWFKSKINFWNKLLEVAKVVNLYSKAVNASQSFSFFLFQATFISGPFLVASKNHFMVYYFLEKGALKVYSDTFSMLLLLVYFPVAFKCHQSTREKHEPSKYIDCVISIDSHECVAVITIHIHHHQNHEALDGFFCFWNGNKSYCNWWKWGLNETKIINIAMNPCVDPVANF